MTILTVRLTRSKRQDLREIFGKLSTCVLLAFVFMIKHLIFSFYDSGTKKTLRQAMIPSLYTL